MKFLDVYTYTQINLAIHIIKSNNSKQCTWTDLEKKNGFLQALEESGSMGK